MVSRDRSRHSRATQGNAGLEKFLIANDNPTRIVIPLALTKEGSDQRLALRTATADEGKPRDRPYEAPKILIENPRLEFRLTPTKLSARLLSNRKNFRSFGSHFSRSRGFDHPGFAHHSSLTCPEGGRSRRRSPITALLTGTLNKSEISSTHCKHSTYRNSNK